MALSVLWFGGNAAFADVLSFTTRGGKKIDGATVRSATAEHLTFDSASGVHRIPYSELPEGLARRYFTFTSNDGKRVEGGTVHHIAKDSVMFFTEASMVTVRFSDMPVDILERFGLTPEQVRERELALARVPTSTVPLAAGGVTVRSATAEHLTFDSGSGVHRIPYSELPEGLARRYFTFTSNDGRRVEDGTVHKIAIDNVMFFTEASMVAVRFSDMPVDILERFGLTPEQVRARELALASVPTRIVPLAAYRTKALPVPKRVAPAAIPAPAGGNIPKAIPPASPQVIDLEHFRNWAISVCLSESNGRAYRWTLSPLVSIHQATAAEAEVVNQAVEELNRAFGESPMRLAIGDSRDIGAAIHIYFADPNETPEIYRKYGIGRDRRGGQKWRWWNGDASLRRALVVVVRSGQLQTKDSMLRRLFWAIGLSSTSNEVSPSIFAGFSDISDLDKELIQFFYTNVRAGDTRREIREAATRYWRSSLSYGARNPRR